MFYFTDDMFSSVLKQPNNYLNLKYGVSLDFTLKWDQRYELPQSCSKRYEFSLWSLDSQTVLHDCSVVVF